MMFPGFTFNPDKNPLHSNVMTGRNRIINACRDYICLTQIVFTLISPKVLYLHWQPSILLIYAIFVYAVCTYEMPLFSLFPLLVSTLAYGTDLPCYRQERM